MLPPGPAPERHTSIDGQVSWSLMTSYTSGDAFSRLDPFVGLYIHTAKIIQGIPIVASTLRRLVGASSLPPDQDSSDDYFEIGVSVCEDSAGVGHLIFMVAPNGDQSHNSSSIYPTIRRSEASDAQTTNDGMTRNLNPDFNAI
jgi:hypothetical protein